ncbi:helix-turn-helix domain-containing protein [Maribacter sp. 2210JD10-5]|uniref:helix-turn-helix domain-containing protein n=1 Tax=Maribacter sp. 2210JD10-5 TaxID=3386272 RepID=UPI0039BD8F17
MFVLKELRRKKNINQTDLAHAIGVSLRTIQLYEKKDANIPIKNLTKIAQYFDVSIADLYSHESVNENGSTYRRESKKPDKLHTIFKLNPGKYLLEVPLVVAEVFTEYILEYQSVTFMQSLPHVGFIIDQVAVSDYIAFEITNDAMDDNTIYRIPKKAIALGKSISIPNVKKRLKNTYDAHWIIVHQRGIMCRQIIAYNANQKTITCHSPNKSPEYVDFDIHMDEIEQIFEVVGMQI